MTAAAASSFAAAASSSSHDNTDDTGQPAPGPPAQEGVATQKDVASAASSPEYVKLAVLWLAACIDKAAFRQNMRAIACKATHEGALVRGHRKHARDAALQVLGLGMGVSVEPVVSMDYVDAVWAATELASGGRIACPPTPAYPGGWAHATEGDGRPGQRNKVRRGRLRQRPFFHRGGLRGDRGDGVCVYATLAIMLNATIQFFVVTCTPGADPDDLVAPITSGPTWMITLLQKSGHRICLLRQGGPGAARP